MRPALWRTDCTISGRTPGKASSRAVSRFSQGALRCCQGMLLENANDKIRSLVRVECAQPLLLSNRVDKDRRTQSGPAVLAPRFLRLRGDLAGRGIASCATREENESCKRATAHSPSALLSGPGQ